ncbi:MAG: MATE family efflux transporter [Clostridia bacterium]|nr:MATE family efflux transporter [Clostridia bacterium]
MTRSTHLSNTKISKLLIEFSIPAIVGMLVNALYNVADRIFIGNGVGSLGIAGITVGFPMMIIIMAFGMLIGMGATALISIRLGEEKIEEAELIMGNAMVLLILLSVALSAIGYMFMDPLLKLFGASKAVLPYAREYIRVILLGTVFSSIGFGMNNFIRAEGNPRIAMFTMLIGAFLNIILDPIFIFVLGMGMSGAAIATIISQFVSAAWVLYYFFSPSSLLKIRKKNLKLDSAIIARTIAIGSAPFAMQLASSLLFVVFNNSLRVYGGDVAISGMGVVNSVSALLIMPVIGISQGAQPIIGFNYGAKQYDRVKEALKLAIIFATIVVCLGFVISMAFPSQIMSLFNKGDHELIAFGSKALRIFLLLLPVIGFQIAGSGYFHAVGKPRQAMFLSLSRQVLILIPLILILPRFYGLYGILFAAPISDLAATILTAVFLANEMSVLNFEGKRDIVSEPR